MPLKVPSKSTGKMGADAVAIFLWTVLDRALKNSMVYIDPCPNCKQKTHPKGMGLVSSTSQINGSILPHFPSTVCFGEQSPAQE